MLLQSFKDAGSCLKTMAGKLAVLCVLVLGGLLPFQGASAHAAITCPTISANGDNLSVDASTKLCSASSAVPQNGFRLAVAGGNINGGITFQVFHRVNDVTVANLPSCSGAGCGTPSTTGTAALFYCFTNSGPCDISYVYIDNGGQSITVSASIANHQTTPVTFSISDNLGSPSLTTTQTAPPSLTVGVAAATFTPVAGSGGLSPYTYALYNAGNTATATLPAGLSFSTTTGEISGTPTAASAATTYTVRVTDSASSPAKVSVTFSLTVQAASQTITFPSTYDATSYGTAFSLAYAHRNVLPLSASVPSSNFGFVTASSGLNVTYTAGPSGVCTTSDYNTNNNGIGLIHQLSILGQGTCTIVASQPGNATFAAAPTVTHTITITKGDQGLYAYNAVAPQAFSANGTYNVAISSLTTPYTNPQVSGDYHAVLKPTLSTAKSSDICSIGATTLDNHFASSTAGTWYYGTAQITMLKPGNCIVTASQAGDANYNAATDTDFTYAQTAPPLNTTQSVASVAASTGIAMTPVTPVTGSGGYGSIAYSVSPSLPSGLTMSASGQISGTPTVAITATQFTVTVTDDASQTSSKNFTLTVNSSAQTITFGPNPGAQTFVPQGTFAVSATGGASGNAVTFSVPATTSVCSVSGSTVAMLSAGNCTVAADQAGNGNYLVATQVTQTIIINKASQTITFGSNPGAQTFAASGTFSVSATGGASGSTVTFSVPSTTSVCSVSGSTVTMLSAGDCTVVADQAGNTSFTAATQVTQTISITQATQTITFGNNPGPQTYAPGGTFNVSAAGGASGNAVTFSVPSTTSVCRVSGSTVTMLAAGNCIVAADQSGNVSYTAAAQVTQTIVISQAVQTITFTSTPSNPAHVKGASYFVTATGGATNNPVTFSIDAPSAAVCSIAGSTVSFLAGGTCTINANQAGNGNYTAAAQAQQNVNVNDTITPATQAAGGFISDRGNSIVSGQADFAGQGMDRLNNAAGQNGASSALTDQEALAAPKSDLPPSAFGSGAANSGTIIPAVAVAGAASPGMQDLLGLQAMLRDAMQNAGQSGSMDRFNYSGPFNASISAHEGLTASFHTSLSQMRKWQQQQDTALGIGGSRGGSAYSPVDIWLEGTYAGYGGKRSGRFGLFTIGTDYVINPNILIGVFTQVDTMSQTSGTAVSGTGFMIGPYTTLRLNDQLFWNARAAWGRSGNMLAGSGDFTSTRWLAASSISGRWKLGRGLTLTPDFGFTYFSDYTDAYKDTFGVIIPRVKTELGQLKFSPTLSYGFVTDNSLWLEPSITPELLWNFASTNVDGLGALSDTATGPIGLRGKLKAGLSLRTPQGLAISASGSYDGIGSAGYNAITAQARLNVPLN